MPTVELRFGALPGHVRTARLIAAAICRRVGVPADMLDEVKLAVGEACARAVALNRRHAPDTMVVVRLTDSADGFSIEVEDAGPARRSSPPGSYSLDGVDPLAGLVPPPPTGRGGAAGGPGADVTEAGDTIETDLADDEPEMSADIGLALIEGLVDEMTIATGSAGAGTVVTMHWRSALTGIDFGQPERALAES
jgi:anti-sigma regulatory factor (Ser/Thr protein kinase)